MALSSTVQRAAAAGIKCSREQDASRHHELTFSRSRTPKQNPCHERRASHLATPSSKDGGRKCLAGSSEMAAAARTLWLFSKTSACGRPGAYVSWAWLSLPTCRV